MSTSHTVSELAAIARRLRLSTSDLATLIGIAPQTVRLIELTSRLPSRRAQREAVERFVDRSRVATKRSELRLEDLEVQS